MTQRSRLHVPHPPARPGDRPDFGYVRISPAGAVARPDITAAAADIEELATQLVRVLDDQQRAVGPWNPHLEASELQVGLRHMLLTRLFDDRMQRMQRQGRISFYIKSTGEEAVSVAQCMAVLPGDMLFPSYRNQGLYVVRGRSLTDLMCQCLSNTRDMCKGRQLPVMYQWAAGNIFSISGNLATQFPQAVGWAMAAAIKGEDRIASTWIGEGSSAEADFHHALTFAAVYRAPVILNVVNNQWAISTFQGFAGGERWTFAARGPGYGIPGIRVDGNDFLAVHAVSQWAAERARRSGGPTLIEHVTYRAAAHSTSDDPSRYRPKEDWASWPLGDPIDRLKRHLIGLGEWSQERHAALEKELEAHVTDCWKEAVKYGTLTEGPTLDPLGMFEDVFKQMPPHLLRQREELKALRAQQAADAARESTDGARVESVDDSTEESPVVSGQEPGREAQARSVAKEG
ncbi:MAG TPA: thiamine pyrophosphate-dependent enzyme [Steroidobacteraceae bacterium]|nr:thiamine pyrophosphate-dependent enzyme [Steroidobacteraceae bacterium]